MLVITSDAVAYRMALRYITLISLLARTDGNTGFMAEGGMNGRTFPCYLCRCRDGFCRWQCECRGRGMVGLEKVLGMVKEAEVLGESH